MSLQVNTLNKRIKELESKLSNAIATQKRQSEAAEKTSKELEEQLERVQGQLERANSQNRQLQGRVSESTARLGDLQEKSSERTQVRVLFVLRIAPL